MLGPNLFNIFINDVISIESAGKVLFADDAVFYVTDNSLSRCVDKIRTCISDLNEWFDNNKLILNVDKTKLMFFSPKKDKNVPVIMYQDKSIEWVNSIKYLGIILDNNMNFVLQSRDVLGKLSKLNGIFYALVNYMPQKTLITLFYSLVYPTIINNLIIWGGISQSHTVNIKVAMNKILRGWDIMRITCLL